MQQPSSLFSPRRRSPNIVQEDPSGTLYETLKGGNAFRWDQRFSRDKAQTIWPPERCEVTLRTPLELTDEQIVDGLSAAMDYAAERNTDDDDMPSWEDPISVFFSVTKPDIETSVYVKRLVKYAQCSRASFIIVLVYLKRLEEANRKLGITSYNMHRLLITALMLAAKMLDDRCFSNAHYARVGGISTVREVNRLEIQMLELLNYRLLVTPDEYFDYAQQILQRCAPRSPRSDCHHPEIHPGNTSSAQQLRLFACPSTMIDEASSNPILDKQAPIYPGDDGIYQFHAPGRDYHVLPLEGTDEMHESVFGYRFPGVRSRVYR